jgi:5-methylcytosine-specific restriction endonuclease McrA
VVGPVVGVLRVGRGKAANMKRHPIPKWKRDKQKKDTIKAYLLRKRPVCFYCGCRLNEETATMDHVVPSCNGGGTDFENLVLSCRDCNRSKGALSAEEFKKMRKARV